MESTPEQMAAQETLDIQNKIKQDAMENVSKEITEAINLLSEKLDMKIMLVGLSNVHGEYGIWNAKGTDRWDQMAIARIVDKTC